MARDLLKQAHIAAPCPASWNSMEGDDKVRFCSKCRLNVYNVAEMSWREANLLIQEHEGKLCIRAHWRADGMLMARNCPIGLASVRRRLAYAITLSAAAVMGGFASALAGVPREEGPTPDLMLRARQVPVVGPVVNWLSPPTMGEVTGKIAAPTPRRAAVKKTPAAVRRSGAPGR